MQTTSDSQRLKDRVALITGASRGIGQAIAVKFAQEGADLFLCATDMKKLQETRKQTKKFERRVELYALDIADRSAVEVMVGKAIQSFGKIDILVNNAGTYKASRFVDYSHEDFDRVMKVNLYGPFYVTQLVLKHMLPRKKGKIVNIASTAGKWGSLNQSAYNISKHGVVGMTRCIALETATQGITVNAICPGLVETDMGSSFGDVHGPLLGITPQETVALVKQRIPMRRYMLPEEVAHLAVYLASSESDGMTGQSIVLDGGMLLV